MQKPKLSLILPCYNEGEHLIGSVEKIFNILNYLPFSSEVIFIDDKSSDNTRFLLKKIQKKYKSISLKAIFHKKNMGRGATVSEGIRKSKGDIVGFIDVDCEIAPHYVPIFVKAVKSGYSIVTAHRIYEFSFLSVHRWLASKIYALLVKKVFNLSLNDTEAGYKFFLKDKIIPVLDKIKDSYWFWDTEILVRASIAKLKILEIPVVFVRRKDKTSTVKIIQDTLKYLKGIIRLRKELKKYESF